ncbi:phosphoribosyl-ATP diphosphatase [Clostridium massiliamazoniense]|uniref:phosphoribosyl-ATP diphosphatase n=1 Tax=Clostridium massiliamazoniense TaxID=1347366 RepID=UPI0006D83ABF|nr:phosphoribosyl-ATP diphosphatase [Clostridium massiliamazoniense]
MENILNELYEVINNRKENQEEGSYTTYLFNKGLDKILKKVGEESTEVIIAAKGENKEEQIEELCDLSYHILVLMAQLNIKPSEVEKVLIERRKKIGNLKPERAKVENL